MDENPHDLWINSNTKQLEEQNSTNNNLNSSMSSLTYKKSSLMCEDLNDVANPFESATFDSMTSSQLSLKSSTYNLEMDKLNETFEKLSSRQSFSNDMSLSGQDMPEMDSLKGDENDENKFQSGECELIFIFVYFVEFILFWLS